MKLSLTNYKAALPPALLKKAEKNKVRECDETKKGHFVAYVDEGNETFDVSLVVSTDKQISSHSCDCKRNGFCHHRAALLVHIANGTKTKQGIKTKNKITAAETLLDEADANDLKEWVKSLLLKNKDIELAFMHHFSNRKQQLSPEDVTKITVDAVKAVARNKRKFDPTELKKIVELWEDIHLPVLQHYQANVSDERSFLCFHALIESCGTFQQGPTGGTNRIDKYLKGLLQESTAAISNLLDETAWSTATNYFVDLIQDDKSRVLRMHYLLHLVNILSISSPERKTRLIRQLASQYQNTSADRYPYGTEYTSIILHLVEENGLFKDFYKKFKPSGFDHRLNTTLIQALIKASYTEQAEKYCHQLITDSSRDENNIPYLEFLKGIYTVKSDENNLMKVLRELVPHTFNFSDFLFIHDHIPGEEEKKKWRTKMIKKTRTYYHKNEAIEFCFKLAEYEKKYARMIEYVDSYTPNRIIVSYFEQMVQADKTALLQALINRSEWSFGREEKEGYLPALFEITVKHYSPDYLIKAIEKAKKDRYYFGTNPFLRFIQAKLAPMVKSQK